MTSLTLTRLLLFLGARLFVCYSRNTALTDLFCIPGLSRFSIGGMIQYPTLRETPFISALQTPARVRSTLDPLRLYRVEADHELNSGRWSRPRPVEMT
ncbi:hypothetical protein IQ07DRAFT_588330, partial [Pyrenochaeta sp. DS3sAY3a]